MGVFVRAPRCGTGEDARHSISCVRPGKGKLRPAIGQTQSHLAVMKAPVVALITPMPFLSFSLVP